MRACLFALGGALLLSITGCSRDYAPADTASGEDIYKAACSECHKTNDNGSILQLSKDQSNIEYIAQKVRSGSLLMPSFPNVQTDDLNKIATYMLEHSTLDRD